MDDIRKAVEPVRIRDSTFRYNDIDKEDCGTYGVTGKGWILNVVGGIDRLSGDNINDSLGHARVVARGLGRRLAMGVLMLVEVVLLVAVVLLVEIVLLVEVVLLLVDVVLLMKVVLLLLLEVLLVEVLLLVIVVIVLLSRLVVPKKIAPAAIALRQGPPGGDTYMTFGKQWA